VAGTHVALIRGINVGRAKRVAMADLRALLEDLGYGDVRTLLNSGNAVFAARDAKVGAAVAAARIEEALARKLGVVARVMVLTTGEVAAAVAGNPLIRDGKDPSRLLVAFLSRASDRKRLEPLLDREWAPEALGLGPRVVYLWCPAGVLASEVAKAVGGALGDSVTTRNWSTVTKLLALAQGASGQP
jgi:uncharacterized protein (DUF1697 family)